MEKVQEMYQVFIKKTNEREPPFKCRKKQRWYRNWVMMLTQDRVWRTPVYWSSGTRHRGGVILIWAFTLNCRNLRQRVLREKHKQRTCEADSTDALPRDGETRSSEEALVMRVERRGLVTQPRTYGQLATGGVYERSKAF